MIKAIFLEKLLLKRKPRKWIKNLFPEIKCVSNQSTDYCSFKMLSHGAYPANPKYSQEITLLSVFVEVAPSEFGISKIYQIESSSNS